jgi:hypothetical protein
VSFAFHSQALLDKGTTLESISELTLPRMNLCVEFPFAVLVLGALAPALRSQYTSASLSGRVTDPSRARIVGAKVSAINADTNVRYQTISNGVGEYYLADIQPGLYRIEVEKTGFKKLVKPDVILHVQDALDIDFEMRVGPRQTRFAWRRVRLCSTPRTRR